MEKNNNGLIITLFIIIGVLLAAVGFFLGKELANKEDKKETKEPEVKAVELKESDKLVKEALELIPDEFCGGLEFPFEKGNITINDLTKSDKLNMVISALGKNSSVENEESFKEYYFTEDTIKKYFEDLSFLDDFKGGKTSSYTILSPFILKYKDNRYYLSQYATGCTGFGPERGEITFKSAEKKDNTLTITVYYYYVASTGDVVEEGDYGYFIFNVYKDSTKKEIVQKEIKEDKEIDLEKYNTYTLTFDISNDNLRFTGMNAN